jgi:hypothetical protein
MKVTIVRTTVAALLALVFATSAAAAQYTLDAKGRRYQCLTGDWSCSVLPPPGAPPRGIQHRAPRQHPPPFMPCGARCDLLDRMK